MYSTFLFSKRVFFFLKRWRIILPVRLFCDGGSLFAYSATVGACTLSYRGPCPCACTAHRRHVHLHTRAPSRPARDTVRACARPGSKAPQVDRASSGRARTRQPQHQLAGRARPLRLVKRQWWGALVRSPGYSTLHGVQCWPAYFLDETIQRGKPELRQVTAEC